MVEKDKELHIPIHLKRIHDICCGDISNLVKDGNYVAFSREDLLDFINLRKKSDVEGD